jgi:hypothetical protein
MENKKVAPKKPTIKKVAPKKPTVEMVSYSIEMTIPTGAYANIKPSIVVKGGSIQEAHDFIAPHMNKLWKEYFLINERRPEPVKTKEAPLTAEQIVDIVGGHEIGGAVPADVPSSVPGPDSSVALLKATQAIESCLSTEALELIETQVIKSVKLSHEDKEALMPLLSKKAIELTFPEDEKRGN